MVFVASSANGVEEWRGFQFINGGKGEVGEEESKELDLSNDQRLAETCAGGAFLE